MTTFDQLEIHPSAWTKAGGVFEDHAADVRTAIENTVSASTNPATIGCQGGYALIDDAIAVLISLLGEMMGTLKTDMVSGLEVDGQSMILTGQAYKDYETTAGDAAAGIEGAV